MPLYDVDLPLELFAAGLEGFVFGSAYRSRVNLGDDAHEEITDKRITRKKNFPISPVKGK